MTAIFNPDTDIHLCSPLATRLTCHKRTFLTPLHFKGLTALRCVREPVITGYMTSEHDETKYEYNKINRAGNDINTNRNITVVR